MKVPVTIITGYLGAGKTTLLQRIAGESGMRLAIIINEFGEIAIDSRIVKGKNIVMAELAGGCVCCSLCGEFSLAVAELLEAAEPEWIVVETTGAAEPAALVHDIRENIPRVRLDSVVTVVDADAMARFPSLGATGREQIELADIIIINKADLIDEEALARVRRAVAGLNGRAVVMEAERCGIWTGALFGIGRNAPAPERKAHHVEFRHFGFAAKDVLEHGPLMRVLETLPSGIYRAKGFARTDRGCFLANYVAGRLELEERECSMTELVFIGIDAEKCQDGVIRSLEAVPAAKTVRAGNDLIPARQEECQDK
ncbi:GTP-binding protein [Candidatus Micrarchaeota archaeon]|nr:GTP-binding protein [Candidatus Micrarchaeota archaeon]